MQDGQQTDNQRARFAALSISIDRFDDVSVLRNALLRPSRQRRLSASTAASTDAMWGYVYGTSKGQSTAPGSDMRRWASVVAWRQIPELEDVCTLHATASSGKPTASSIAIAVPFAAKGALHSTQPRLSPIQDDRPVLSLTTARVPLRRQRVFNETSRRVADSLATAANRSFSIGIGRWPIGQLATLSVWQDNTSLSRWAAAEPHRQAVGRARADNWFSSEFFGRFWIKQSDGPWA